jgi:hypothetical protein
MRNETTKKESFELLKTFESEIMALIPSGHSLEMAEVCIELNLPIDISYYYSYIANTCDGLKLGLTSETEKQQLTNERGI